MTEIIPDPVFSPMTSLKKGASAGIVGAIALAVLSCFHGLTPEQKQAGAVCLIGVLETARNSLKKKFPHFFNWL